MKNSGIEWIGEIPEHWETIRLKTIAPILRGASPRPINDPKYFDDNGKIYWVRINDVTKSNGYLYSCSQKLSDIGVKFSVQLAPNTLFISICASLGKPCITKVPCCIHDGFIYFKNLDKRLNKFIYYIFETGKCFEGLAKLGTQQNLNTSLVGNIKIPFPSTIENIQAIANYLDEKCAEIDNLSSAITEQIEVLKQYKKSVITEAVTKGLDPNAPMKDSGVEWIGEIPEKWEVTRLKYAMNNFDSQRKPIEAQKRNQNSEILYDYYGASGIIDKIDNYIFDEPAILIGEDGANLLLRNLPLIYIAKGKYWVNNHAHILRPKSFCNFYYMAYMLESLDYTTYITGSAQPKLSQENLNNVFIVLPPLSEQQAIADYLDDKCAQIDSVIKDKETQLETLAAYKKSLIYEYVTGKKEVPQLKEV